MKVSFAVTTAWKATPAVAVAGAVTVNDVALPAMTLIGPDVLVRLSDTLSVAVMV